MDGSNQASGADGVIPGFDALYREHFGFVYACLLRQGVPASAVDDAVQDVFVTVHRRLPDFEGRSSVRSWLFGILRRVAFRHRRTAQRAQHKARAMAEHPRAEVGLAESLEHAQRSAQLLAALDELDDDKRAALTLHVFEELRGPELAEILGINVDTAYSRIKAARRELQRALAQMGVDHDEPALVAATRRHTTADRGAARRVAAALAIRLAPGAGKSVAAAWAGYKTVIAALALGAVATVAVGLSERAKTRAVVPARTPTTVTAAPTPAITADGLPPAELADAVPAVPIATPSVPVDSPAKAPTGARTRPAPTPPVADPPRHDAAIALEAEVALITTAKTALDADDPERALAALASHARQFPTGQLAHERAGYRAIALCAAGKLAAGRGEARLFASSRPASPLRARIDRTCGIRGTEDAP